MNAIRPFRPRPPAVRGLAAFCALMLVASNALAAMGLCIVKAPHPAQDAQAVAALVFATDTNAADEPGCPEHAQAAAAEPPAPVVGAAHCTQDDPGAQVRANDVPPAALDAVPVFQRIALIAPPRTAGVVTAPDMAPAAALYARLSRLLL